MSPPFNVVCIHDAADSRLRPSQFGDQPRSLCVNRIHIDLEGREVLYDGSPVPVTQTEFRILTFLAEHPGRARSRNEISMHARNDPADPLDRTIDAHIKNLRRKLGPGGAEIQTIRAFGYKIRRPAPLLVPPAPAQDKFAA